MKGVICCFSATGNTLLVADHLVRRLGADFDLFDIAKPPAPDLSKYDLVGFASPVERMSEPRIMQDFMRNLPPAPGKPAFLLVTYGAMAGSILENLTGAAHAKGYKVVEAHALHVPDSFPPLIALGLDSRGEPNEKNLREFDLFIDRLNAVLADLLAGHELEEYIFRPRLRNSLVPRMARELSRRTMGPKLVDEKLCTGCGECARRCPYKAIKLDPLPVFYEKQCRGCWACYNLCPGKAIYTRMLRGKGHYPGPTEEFKRKLGR